MRNFIPLQPELEMNTDYYIEFKEKNFLDQSTILFYQFRINEDLGSSISVIPDGCIDILFACNVQQPFANVYGSVLHRKAINFQTTQEYFGVRLLPKKEQKLNHSMKDIIEQEVPLTEIISVDDTVIEKIANEKDFYGRIRLFKEMIGSTLFTYDSSSNLVRYALNKIYSSKGNVNINQLAVETGYSTRYLRKQFEECVGISPKLFSQIVRFQHSLYMLIKRNNYTIWDVVNENGYYDQAHLINEFKKFGYLTPGKVLGTLSQKIV